MRWVLTLFLQELLDRLQLDAALCGAPGIGHLEPSQRIQNDLGDDERAFSLSSAGTTYHGA